MATKMTLERLLTKIPDGELLDIHAELLSEIVPATGCAHSFCRKVNRMIDKGELCINPSTYRKVYLPTLSKALLKELANRYASAVTTGRIVPDTQSQMEFTFRKGEVTVC